MVNLYIYTFRKEKMGRCNKWPARTPYEVLSIVSNVNKEVISATAVDLEVQKIIALFVESGLQGYSSFINSLTVFRKLHMFVCI